MDSTSLREQRYWIGFLQNDNATNRIHRFPHETMLHSYGLPTLLATVALNAGNARQALDLLRVVDPYLRGLSYLRLQQGGPAAHEFQRILDHRGIVGNNIWGALAHLQLGRAQEMKAKWKLATHLRGLH